MKTRMNILTLACALTCFSCIGTAHTIQPSLKSASNLNDNLNCSKELEHYAS